MQSLMSAKLQITVKTAKKVDLQAMRVATEMLKTSLQMLSPQNKTRCKARHQNARCAFARNCPNQRKQYMTCRLDDSTDLSVHLACDCFITIPALHHRGINNG